MMGLRPLDPKFARRAQWISGFAVSMFLGSAAVDACRGRTELVPLDLAGMALAVAASVLVERLVGRDMDTTASLLAALPARRRVGLRMYLQGEKER